MCPETPASSPQQPWVLPEDVAATIETQVVPRLMVAHRVGIFSPAQLGDATRRLAREDVEHMVALLTGAPDAAADLFLQALLEQGVTSEAVYLDLLTPAAQQLGEMWSNDVCDFVEVSIALGRMQRILHSLSELFLAEVEPGDAVGRILLAGVPGEQHTLGLFMVAEFFVRDGWLVSVGPPLIEEDLLRRLRNEWFDVIGFSVACDTRLSHVTREINRVRRSSSNRLLQVLVGGRIFNEQPGLVQRVGADASATDGREATRVARVLIGAKERSVNKS